MFDGSGTLVNCALVFGGFDTLGSCAVFSGVVACPKISANFESAGGLVLPMGRNDDTGVRFGVACMRSCAEVVAASVDDGKGILFSCGEIPQFVLSIMLCFWECISDSSGNDQVHGLHTNLTHCAEPMFYGQLEFHALFFYLGEPLECG